MTKKTRRNFFIGSIASVFVMAVAVLFGTGKVSLKPFVVRGVTEPIEGNITWTVANSEKSGSGRSLSFLRRTQRGNGIYLYSYGQYTPVNDELIETRKNDSLGYGLFVKSEAGSSGSMYQFQFIDSITVETTSSHASASGIEIYTTESGGSPVYSASTLNASSSVSIKSNGASWRYLRIIPKNTGSDFCIKSVSVSYTCFNGGLPAEKTLLSLSLDGQKLSFGVGESFSFGGTATAYYSDATTKNVTSEATIDSTNVNMSVEGDYQVNVSYSDEFGDANTSYMVSVSEGGGEVTSETYSYTFSTSTYQIVISSDNSGYYSYIFTGSPSTTYTIHFTWVLSGSTYTFTKDAQEGDSEYTTNGYYYRSLFGGTNTTNTGTQSSSNIVVKLRNRDGETNTSNTTLSKIS